MAASDTYIQFPLCLLSYPCKVDKRIKFIIDYGIGYYAQCLMNNQNGDIEDILLQDGGYFHISELDEKSERWEVSQEDVLFIKTAKIMGLPCDLSSVEKRFDRFMRTREFQTAFECKNGKDAEVRIRIDIARDVNKTLNMRDFAVLCAIYSKIGDKRIPVLITNEEILHRARGFKSKKVAKAECPHTDSLALTSSKVRRAINDLHKRGFFVKTTYAGRLTYYGLMSENELRKAVIARKTKSTFAAQQSEKDREMTEEIRKLRKAA